MMCLCPTQPSAGKQIAGADGKFDWARLDEYAGYLHEQDAARQKQGVQALPYQIDQLIIPDIPTIACHCLYMQRLFFYGCVANSNK